MSTDAYYKKIRIIFVFFFSLLSYPLFHKEGSASKAGLSTFYLIYRFGFNIALDIFTLFSLFPDIDRGKQALRHRLIFSSSYTFSESTKSFDEIRCLVTLS